MTLKIYQMRLRQGLRPGLHWGAHDALQIHRRLRRVIPPHSHVPRRLLRLINAFGAELLDITGSLTSFTTYVRPWIPEWYDSIYYGSMVHPVQYQYVVM